MGLNHSIDLIHLVRSSAGNVDQSAASFSRVLCSLSVQAFSLSLACPGYATSAAARQLDVTFQLGTSLPLLTFSALRLLACAHTDMAAISEMAITTFEPFMASVSSATAYTIACPGHRSETTSCQGGPASHSKFIQGRLVPNQPDESHSEHNSQQQIARLSGHRCSHPYKPSSVARAAALSPPRGGPFIDLADFRTSHQSLALRRELADA